MTVEVPSVRNPAPRTLPGMRNWWVEPALVAIGFTAFIVYSFWSVVLAGNDHAWLAGPYLSPFYSPLIRWSAWPLSSAILVAWIPLGFRATCYYYRKAYYRAYFRDPPACAVREPFARGNYSGERRFPFVLNNFHRFFLYLALIVLGVLWYDTVSAFQYRGTWYVGIGSVFMAVNVILLTLYTFSCHALRHLVGGSVNCYSCAFAGTVRHGLWGLVSKINPSHARWAWFSLVSVAAVDIYIRLVAGGVFGSCFGAHTGC